MTSKDAADQDRGLAQDVAIVVQRESIKDLAAVRHILMSSLFKIALFLFLAMPVVFLLLMGMGAHAFVYLGDWPFERGYNFMASAITGGAIAFPADDPTDNATKFCAAIAGAAGVGLFGFMIATLSGSLVDPVIDVFELNATGHTLGSMFRKLMSLASIVMLTNLLMAVIFGWILYLFHEFDFVPAVKAMASIELGGGVIFHGQPAPETPAATRHYTVIGVWAIGVAAVMIAIVGGPAAHVVEKEMGLVLKTGATIRTSVEKLALLVLLVLPAVLFLVMLLVAGIMAPLTTWEFQNAFWAALPATTGGAAALSSSENPPLHGQGVVILICAASMGFFIVSIVIGVGAQLMDPIIEHVTLLHMPRGYSGASAVCVSLVALVIISFVLIPAAVFAFAVPLGGILAYLEGWQFHDGFWWCVAVQLGGGMSLTSAQIDNPFGMIVGTIAVAWSIGISVITVGFSGAPIVVPLMEAMGLRALKQELHKVLDAVEAIPLKSSAALDVAVDTAQDTATGLVSAASKHSLYGATDAPESASLADKENQ